MEVFFSIPTELQKHTLTFLEPSDLDYLFSLQKLQPLSETYNAEFLKIQHLALTAKYYDRQVILSNNAQLASISFSELDYLLEHNISICPAEITVAFFDFTNYQQTLAFTSFLFQRYLGVLQCFTRNFNIRLILVENVALENDFLKSIFQPLCMAHLNVRFTIKYAPGIKLNSPKRRGNELELGMAEFLSVNSEIAVESLLLHLFNSNNLLKHFVEDNGCFCCQGLRVLNLSYNHLTDMHLATVRFPDGLEQLNLSNNLLQNLTKNSFIYENLTSLRSLDLSNNNLMSLTLPVSNTHQKYKLKQVNLSGNLLASYEFLDESRLFQNVAELDLSRNLLEVLTPFPASVRVLDLTGNYFTFPTESLVKAFPPRLETLKVSGFISRTNDTSSTVLNLTTALLEGGLTPELKELYICGTLAYDLL